MTVTYEQLRIAALELIGFAEHSEFCGWHEKKPCSCGYTETYNIICEAQKSTFTPDVKAEPVQEPVASVTECEACFTPDVCQLRGTCDHYAAERLRVAAPPQREPVHQWRKQMCADWYDGHPDHSDGGGPYETRVLYSAPPQRKPLTDQEAKVLWADVYEPEPHIWVIAERFARAMERAHGIGGKK